MPALTRAEAADRAALLRVDSYAIDLDLTTGGGFGSVSTVQFTCHRPGAATWLDIRPATLQSATLNGVPLDPQALDGGRLPLDGLAARNELVVRARMAYTNTGEGLHRFVDPADGRAYVYAMSFLDAAPQVFGCFDQPDLKAPVTLSVLADPQWTVVANGAPVGGSATADDPVTGSADGAGGRLWRFGTTLPLATYFTTLAAGPWHAVHTRHDGIPLGVFCRASLAEHLDREAPEIFEVTRACLSGYHDLFGLRYPFGKYDQAFVPEFHFGAMENPGCVTLRDELVFRAAVTRAERADRAETIAHEMAHMWFGDLVTMRWWDDLWLNESFATYMGVRLVADRTRFSGQWTRFALTRKAGGYAADQRPSTHPISAEVPDAARALLNFDAISYAKGASVLRQLVAWVGDEAFLAGLRGYFAAHAYGNASLADLLDALARSSGRNLDLWAEAWLCTAGVDTLTPQVEVDRAGRYQRVTVVHSAPAGQPVRRPHRIGVGCYRRRPGGSPGGAPAGGAGAGPQAVRPGPGYAADEAVELAERVHLDLDPAVAGGSGGALTDVAGGSGGVLTDVAGGSGGVLTDVAALAGRPVADALVLNDGDLTFAKIGLDAATRRRLPVVLPGVADPLARSVLLGAAREATRDARMSPDEFLEVALAVLPGERREDIFGSVLDFAREYVVCRYLPEGRRAAALAALAGACGNALRAAEPGGSLQLAAARGLIACAAPGDGAVRGWLDGQGLPAGLVMDPELRWTALYRLAVLGGIGAADLAAEQQRDRSAAGAEHAARAGAALPEPAAKATAWRTLTESDAVSGRLLAAIASGFWQPEQAALTRPYLSRYVADMPVMARWRTVQLAERIAALAFPEYAVDPDALAAMRGLLGRDDLDPALRRAVTDRTDELRRSITVRAASATAPEPAGGDPLTRPAPDGARHGGSGHAAPDGARHGGSGHTGPGSGRPAPGSR